MGERSQQLDAAVTRAAGSMLAAHVHLGRNVAVRLADRLYPQRTIELYCEAHGLDLEQAEWLKLQALARGGLQPLLQRSVQEERRLRGGILRFRDWQRLHMAPQRDAADALQAELEQSRRCIVKLHTRHALRYAALLGGSCAVREAVEMYLDALAVAPPLRAAVLGRTFVPAIQQVRRSLVPAGTLSPWLPRRSSRPRTAVLA
jgi:hypothetical protein